MKFSKKQLVTYTVSIALFMDVLDTNIINTSIPAMSESLHVSPIDLKIALISYLLSLSVFIPMSGWAADRLGTKQVFLSALGLFTISSFACGFSSTLLQLILSRSIQGIGGAFLISTGRLIIVQTFEKHQFVQAMNTVIIGVSLAVMLGPFIGGVITENFSWPWIFWVNIPAGIIAMFLANHTLEKRPLNKRPFDYLGFILFGGSLALFCLGLSELSESDIDLYKPVCMVFIALLLMLLYIWHAFHYPHPAINIHLFKVRTFRVSIVGNLCSRLGFGGMPFLLPLLQQIGLGFSAQLSGLVLIPLAFGIIFAKLGAYQILQHIGYRKYLIFNTLCVGLCILLFEFITVGTSPYTISFLTFCFGLFIASQFTAMNSLAFADLQDRQLSSATSITSTTQVLAQSLGVAVSAILLRIYLNYTGTTTLSTMAFHMTFVMMALFTFLSIAVFMTLKASDGSEMLRKQTT